MATRVGGEVVLNTTALGGVAEVQVSVSDNVFAPLADGSPDPGIVGTTETATNINFSTHDLVNGLAAAGFGGAALSGAGFTAYVRPLTAGGIRTNTGSTKIVAAAGIMVPRRLSARQGQLASLAIEVFPTSASAAAAVEFSTSNDALTAPTKNVAFTLGKIVLNGSITLDAVQSVDLDFGLQVQEDFGDGLPQRRFAGIIGRTPRIAVEGLDPTLANSIATGGFALTQANLYFRRMALDGGGVVADASDVHLRLSVDVGMAAALNIGGRRVMTGFAIIPRKDTSTEQIALTPNVAIPS